MEDLQVFSQARMAQAAEDASGLMRALSNPARMLILCELVAGEMTVGEIEEALALSQAYVSQQLARLREDGLVAATRDGRQMRYRISDARLRPIMQAIYDQFCLRD